MVKCQNHEGLEGKRFYRLTAIRRVENDPISKNIKYLWQCDCGSQKEMIASNVVLGKSRSCGCLQRELIERKKAQGQKKTRLHRIWSAMKTRCNNPNDHRYYCYGGRGISVCDKWKSSFASFREWASENGYSDDLTIDRIDVNGNYEPSNCRWVTDEVQRNNKRNSYLITYRGNTMTLSQWERMIGINRATIRSRIEKGWPIEAALETPPRTKGQVSA